MSNESFGESTWTPNTVLDFANVNWDSTYRDIVDVNTFDIDKYINDNRLESTMVDRYTAVLPGRNPRVDYPLEQVKLFNYLRVSNTEVYSHSVINGNVVNSIPKTYYYFIVDANYVAPNTTEIVVQLDVWATYGKHVKFGNCFVERGHIGIANEGRMSSYGRDFLAIPEGLDIGSELEIQDIKYHEIGTLASSVVLVWSSTALEGATGHYDYGDQSNATTTMADGSTMDGLPNALSVYQFDSIKALQTALIYLKSTPWVTAGIQCIMVVPKFISRNWTGSRLDKLQCTKIVNSDSVRADNIKIAENFRDSFYRDTRYRNLDKFDVSPYRLIEATTNMGTPLVLKPESIQDNNLSFDSYYHLAVPNPRICYAPHWYNATENTKDNGVLKDSAGNVLLSGGEDLDMLTGIFNFPTFTVLNDSNAMFLASNAHQLAYASQSAEWAENKSLQGNSLAFNQANAAIGASQQSTGVSQQTATGQTDIANTAAMQSAGLNILGGLVGGVAGGPAGIAGGAAGGISQALSTGINVNARNQSTALSNSAMGQQNAISTGLAGYNRDTNKAYADMVAKGDYSNTIAGINAKCQDARVTQPSISGQSGGEAFNLATVGWYLTVKVKGVNGSARRALGEFWLRYGYAVRQYVKIDSISCMEKFTYWKLSESYIKGNIPELYKQTIRGIFEKGVTVWANPDDIGFIDIADNEPKKGLWL